MRGDHDPGAGNRVILIWEDRPNNSGMTGQNQERTEVISRLGDAALQLEQSMDVCLVPKTGSNIAYAIRGARTPGDIAAVAGGLRQERGSVRCSGPVAFGAEEEIARPLLTVLKFDPAVRSAARIRYSDEAFGILSGMFIECAKVPLECRPKDAGLVDWAIASRCSGGVPDAIAVMGETTETSLILLFGEDPARLASNIIILSNRIG